MTSEEEFVARQRRAGLLKAATEVVRKTPTPKEAAQCAAPRKNLIQLASLDIQGEQETFDCVIKDVSAEGIGFLTQRAFPKAKFKVTLQARGGAQFIFKGNVVRAEPAGRGLYEHGGALTFRMTRAADAEDAAPTGS